MPDEDQPKSLFSKEMLAAAALGISGGIGTSYMQIPDLANRLGFIEAELNDELPRFERRMDACEIAIANHSYRFEVVDRRLGEAEAIILNPQYRRPQSQPHKHPKSFPRFDFAPQEESGD